MKQLEWLVVAASLALGCDAPEPTPGAGSDSSTTADAESSTTPGADSTTAGSEVGSTTGGEQTGTTGMPSDSSSTGTTGDTDGTGSSDSGGPAADGCMLIMDARAACMIEGGPVDVSACHDLVDNHPPTGEPAACVAALQARYACYAGLGCDTLDECAFSGCTGDDPCPAEAAAVEAACVRTSCEQYWDRLNECGPPAPTLLPQFCEYRRVLDSFVVPDPQACLDAFDARAECYAGLACRDVLLCNPTFDECDGGIDPCPAEQQDHASACSVVG
ncbi:MAG: hypothetical protein AAGF11_21430 [Myxococcota bacterium]